MIARADNRDKRGQSRVPFYLSAIVIVYVLSFGPACWLCRQRVVSGHVMWRLYRPVTWTAVNAGDWTFECVAGWCSVCGAPLKDPLHWIDEYAHPLELEMIEHSKSTFQIVPRVPPEE